LRLTKQSAQTKFFWCENMRVYHFLKPEHALAAIRDQRLKLAEIDKLNDPFEFLGVASRDPQTPTELRHFFSQYDFPISGRAPHYAEARDSETTVAPSRRLSR
jgi:hypothetical protein